MAKQKGIVTFEGTIDGITFYKRMGQLVARKAGGGFNGKAIRESDSMVRVRENGSEFGGVSQFKKAFLHLLRPLVQPAVSFALHGQLVSLFQQVKAYDMQSERGKRTVWGGLQSSEGRKLVTEFCFGTEGIPFSYQFDAVNGLLTVKDWKHPDLYFPKEAQVMELVFGVLALDATGHPVALYRSPSVWLEREALAGELVQAVTDYPAESGLGIAVVGLHFYQEVNGQRYRLQVHRLGCAL